jgi:hypothetical protein
MKKRLIVSAGMLTLSAGAAFLVLWLHPARPAVTKANFDRVETGMTLGEVEAILGADKGSLIDIDIKLPVGHELETWGGEDGVAWIIFDEHIRVHHKVWIDSPPLPVLDRLRRRLPWLPI